jgi:hypothetical protein
MEKEIVFCKSAVEDHQHIKKDALDMKFNAKVVWKVGGLGNFMKYGELEWHKWEEPNFLVSLQLKQSGFIKLCEHKHANM